MKVIHADENMGTLRARIKGITDATGQYVMFVDSDDYLEVSACEELFKTAYRTSCRCVAFWYGFTRK